MFVYVVFIDDYEKQEIKAIFDNAKEAKKYANQLKQNGEYTSIEKYKINQYAEITQKKVFFWRVYIWFNELKINNKKIHKKGQIEIFKDKETVNINNTLKDVIVLDKYYLMIKSYKNKKEVLQIAKHYKQYIDVLLKNYKNGEFEKFDDYLKHFYKIILNKDLV